MTFRPFFPTDQVAFYVLVVGAAAANAVNQSGVCVCVCDFVCMCVMIFNEGSRHDRPTSSRVFIFNIFPFFR